MINTVWAIAYIEIEDGSSDLDDWYLGTALFNDHGTALTYAEALNGADSLFVHTIRELSVF